MLVEKRNGEYEDVSFDKILKRVNLLCNGEEYDIELNVDPVLIAQKVCSEIYDKVKTSKLDELTSEISISMYSKDPEYAILASRIVISNHQKSTIGDFTEVIKKLYNKDIIDKYLYHIVCEHGERINNMIDYNKDYNIDFFGFKTLQKSYLLRINEEIV